MIIDFHTHTFPDKVAVSAISKLSQVSHTKPFSDGTAVGLSASTKASGIDYSVILPVATSPRQVISINDTASVINETMKVQGLLSFGGIHPDYENWRDELTRISGLGLKGIKIHPVYQRVDLDDLRYLRILDKAAELDLIVVTHSGIDIGYPELNHCSPDKILHAVKQVPALKLVCAHMGGWKMWNEATELLSNTNVYLDTAFSTDSFAALDDGYHSAEYARLLDEAQFLEFVKTFGAQRILFGTDSPWSDQKDSVAWIQSLPLTHEDKDAILGENARNLLQL